MDWYVYVIGFLALTTITLLIGIVILVLVINNLQLDGRKVDIDFECSNKNCKCFTELQEAEELITTLEQFPPAVKLLDWLYLSHLRITEGMWVSAQHKKNLEKIHTFLTNLK